MVSPPADSGIWGTIILLVQQQCLFFILFFIPFQLCVHIQTQIQGKHSNFETFLGDLINGTFSLVIYLVFFPKSITRGKILLSYCMLSTLNYLLDQQAELLVWLIWNSIKPKQFLFGLLFDLDNFQYITSPCSQGQVLKEIIVCPQF